MKKIIISMILAVACVAVAASHNLAGKWTGTLKMGFNKLPLVLHIGQTADNALSATLDSPTQGGYGIECHAVMSGDTLRVGIPAIGGSYVALVESGDSLLTGKFRQGSFELPLSMVKAVKEEIAPTPAARQDEAGTQVTFSHDDITLAGTLTVPEGEGPFPAVVLVSGSGTQDRDESMLGLKPFKVLANFLTAHGVAVLRYDDRGAGKSSPATGLETTFDFALDAQAAFNFLKSQPRIDPHKTGYVGHSEGGQIAFINASRDKDVAFVVSLAGPAVKGRDLLIKQNLSILDMMGVPYSQAQVDEITHLFDAVVTIADTAQLRDELERSLRRSTLQHYTEEQLKQTVEVFTSPWYLTSVRLDPTPYLRKISCPVLALDGEWDCQVDATDNLAAIAATVPNNKCVKLPRHNHMFQDCASCSSPAQSMNYGSLGDISQQTLEAILEFLQVTSL